MLLVKRREFAKGRSKYSASAFCTVVEYTVTAVGKACSALATDLTSLTQALQKVLQVRHNMSLVHHRTCLPNGVQRVCSACACQPSDTEGNGLNSLTSLRSPPQPRTRILRAVPASSDLALAARALSCCLHCRAPFFVALHVCVCVCVRVLTQP